MLRCGVAVRDITPWDFSRIGLAGYAAREGRYCSGRVHDRLWSKALYFERGGEKALLLSADLCELLRPDADHVRQAVREKTGVSQVIVAVTHTHSAPVTIGGDFGFDPAYLRFALDKMIESAVEAASSPFEARVGSAQADAPDVGRNRRKGKTVTDPALTALKIEDRTGALRAALVHYACHCTVLDASNNDISADYPGFLYRMMEKKHAGAALLFTNGAAGDINIGYSADASALGEKMGTLRSFANAERVAERLFVRLEALLGGIRCEDAKLLTRETPVVYPLRSLPSGAELRALAAEQEAVLSGPQSPDRKREAKIRIIYLSCMERAVGLVGRGRTVTASSMLLQIGGMVFVTVPAELFCELGIALKSRLPTGLLGAVIGYANGYIGYLPTREAFGEGGYEAETSPFAEEAGDALVGTLAEAFKALP